MQGLKRTKYCGEFTVDDIGKQAVACGWVQKVHDKGMLVFIDLRDRTGILQLAFDDQPFQAHCEPDRRGRLSAQQFDQPVVPATAADGSLCAHRDQLCDTCKGRLEKNPMRILDCKNPACAEIAKGAPVVLDYICDDCYFISYSYSAISSIVLW